MSKPCKICTRPYPTDEFINKDGICIVCARLLAKSAVDGEKKVTKAI